VDVDDDVVVADVLSKVPEGGPRVGDLVAP
jgi:hypothetical protein